MAGLHKLVVDLDNSLYEDLRDEASKRGQSIAFVIKNLIRSWLVEAESEPTGQYFRKAAKSAAKDKRF